MSMDNLKKNVLLAPLNVEPISFDKKMSDWLRLPCDEVA